MNNEPNEKLTTAEMETGWRNLVSAGYSREEAQGIMRRFGESGVMKSKVTFEEAIAAAVAAVRGRKG